jgi:hypothetical protein
MINYKKLDQLFIYTDDDIYVMKCIDMIGVDGIDWRTVSSTYNLSERLISECRDYVDWDRISEYQNLSENFINKFKDRVNWDHIFINQHLSKSLLRKYKDRVSDTLYEGIVDYGFEP